MKKIILLCLSLLLLYSCGYKEGIIQKAELSYIKFVGNWQNALIEIDGTPTFKLEDYVVKNVDDGTVKESPENKLYQISPGKHKIKIHKDGNLVVDRILLLENQTTTEVFIP